MANGKRLGEVKKYVDTVCNAFLTEHRDIEKVEYRYQANNNKAYLKLTYVYGFAKYFDVTDLTCGNICAMLCVIIAGAEVNTNIKDMDAIREIEKLFK